MSGRFDSKVAFITGASSGIDRATALAFGHEGASVVVTDVTTDGNQQTARMIEQAGGQSLAVSCDVTRADGIKAALDAAVQRFGRLNIVFNNAGIEQPIKPAAEISDDEWNRLVAVNLRGAFLSMRHEVELMLHTRRAHRLAHPPTRPDNLPHRGVGLCQHQGDPIEILRPGDRVFFEPEENHWHGATPSRFMVHIAIQQNDESSSPITWG
jgi:NAD(P)-dependent dehydrogenase (short-subunit alcohol dehydrogenase family)